MAKQFTIVFYECEHNGDLDFYTESMVDCGARIDSQSVDTDQEIGIVDATTPNLLEFRNRFKETEAFEFSSWNN
jgi:hypothetical protein